MFNLRQFTGVPNQRNTAFGIYTPDPQFPGFFAIVTPESGSVTGGSGEYTPYSWYEVLPTMAGHWETFPTARTGDLASGNPAYEFNNIETPAGSAVWLWYGSDVSEIQTQSTGNLLSQSLDMRFAYGDGAGAGSGSGGGCDCPVCPDICHAILVPGVGDGTPTTMYLRQVNGCVTITLDPCEDPSTDCASCLLGQSFGVDATGLSAIATTCDDTYSDPALGGTFLALPGPGGPCDPYTLETPGVTADLFSPNVITASVPCSSGTLDLYVACSNTGAPDDCSVDPGTLYCWYNYVPDGGALVAVQLTLVTKSCDPFLMEFAGPNGERIIWS